MPFAHNNKKQFNNMQLKRDTEDLEFQMAKDDEIDFKEVELGDSGKLDSTVKSKKFSSKRKSNQLKRKCALDAENIKQENDIDFPTVEDSGDISPKKIKLENDSDSEQEFINIAPKGQKDTIPKKQTLGTEFTTSLQDCVKNGDNVIYASEIDSDSEDTPLQELKNKIKIEKHCETEDNSTIAKEEIFATPPKTDNISVGELKIEDVSAYKSSSETEDAYSDDEMRVAIENHMDLNSESGGDGKMENSNEIKMYKTNPKNEEQSLTRAMNQINQKLNLLNENFEILKQQYKAIQDQNSLVLNALSENTIALKTHLKEKNPKHTNRFPLKTMEELIELEGDISERNEEEYITSVRAIVRNRGLKKGLKELIFPTLLVHFNLNGSHNKHRLLNYPKLVNILFHGTYDENSTEKSFKELLREAIKLAKNSFFKENKILKPNNANTSSENRCV